MMTSNSAARSSQESLNVRLMFFQWQCDRIVETARDADTLRNGMDHLFQHMVHDRLVENVGEVLDIMSAAFGGRSS